MAPAVRRTCQVPGCSAGEEGGAYTTLEGLSTQDSVLKDLELHISMVHPMLTSTKAGTNKSDHTDAKPDKFPRPEITDPASESDWSYFLASWESYKRSTNLRGQVACDQLWHCPVEALKKKVFDSGIRPTDSEDIILSGIKRLCVKAHNNMVNIMQFQNIYQDKDDTISQFAAKLNGAASTCDFTVLCECKKVVKYDQNMQAYQFIRGLHDSEIQEKLLAETVNKKVNLADLIKLAEAIESSKRSSSELLNKGSFNKLSQGKIHKTQKSESNPKKCSYCGGNWHTGLGWKKLCKGTNAVCDYCGKKGHLGIVCRSSKKNSSIKETNVLSSESPTTPSPPQEGDAAGIGFFCHMSGECSTLSHVGINKFGKWARIRVEEHPEVDIQIIPDKSGYDELNIGINLPQLVQETNCRGLVDTGAQMVVVGLETIHAMGLTKANLIPVGMKIKAANMGGLKLHGGLLVRISGQNSQGEERSSRQLAYVA